MFFSKKKAQSSPPLPEMRTILCIPGNWNNQSELVAAIALANMQEFIFAGKVLMNLKTSSAFELDLCEADDRIYDSFGYAGQVTGIPEETLEALKEHKSVVYLIGQTGSLASAWAIAQAGLALLKAGGIALKVETAGKAFSKEQWTELTISGDEANLYPMFVVDSLLDQNGQIFTCGMHNLGFRDAIVASTETQEAINMLSIFGYYQVTDQPSIQANQTFSTEVDAPVFLITDEAHQPYAADELFENPFGMWRLLQQ